MYEKDKMYTLIQNYKLFIDEFTLGIRRGRTNYIML